MTARAKDQPPTGPNGSSPGLTSPQFHILLTLVTGSRHGYGIMQEIQRRTEGAVVLGPATLYRSIKQLLDRELIVEVQETGSAESDADSRRRSYALTPAGRARTAEEAQRLRALVRWVEEEIVLEGTGQ